MSNLMMRKTPPPPPVSFYIGDREEAPKRKARLDAIAEQLGLNRSLMLQQIADGDLVVVPRSQVGKAPIQRPSVDGQPLSVGMKVSVATTYSTPDITIPAGQRGTVQNWAESDDGQLKISVAIRGAKVWIPAAFLKAD